MVKAEAEGKSAAKKRTQLWKDKKQRRAHTRGGQKQKRKAGKAAYQKIKAEEAAGQERARQRRDAGGSDAGCLDDGDLATADLEAIVFGRSAVAALDASKPAELVPEGQRGKKRGAPEAAEARVGKKPKAAWRDADDQALRVKLDTNSRMVKLKKRDNESQVTGVEYEKRLREQFVKLHGHATWTEERPQDEASDSEEEGHEKEQRLAASSAKLLAEKKGGMLEPKELVIRRLKNVPVTAGDGKGPAAIKALQFHPTSELLLSAGLDKRLHLCSVDGDENNKLSSHFFKRYPIHHASFTPNGDQVLICGGNEPKLWCLDVGTGEPQLIRPLVAQTERRFYGLQCGPHPGDCPGLKSSSFFSVLGTDGTVLVCDAATKHPIRTIRMRTASITSVFSTFRDTLFTADRECNIYEWDLGSGRCLQHMKDIWATNISTLAMSSPSTFSPTPLLAVGTNTGNVDFFDVSGPKLPKEPTSTVDNLTTSIGCLRFHPGGEIMSASSAHKKHGLKLVHTRTSTVFANWPTQGTPLNRVSAVDFSRRDGLMAVGNEKGKILIYQLSHFEGGGVQ